MPYNRHGAAQHFKSERERYRDAPKKGTKERRKKTTEFMKEAEERLGKSPDMSFEFLPSSVYFSVFLPSVLFLVLYFIVSTNAWSRASPSSVWWKAECKIKKKN